MTRTEITQRALRSAATVTITMLLGCSASVELEPAHESGTATAEAPAEPPAEPVADAGLDVETPPLVLTLHCSMGDGGPDAWQAYDACCSAMKWSPKSGCQAWGPPMPPSMEVA
jgi:hypothetical protein